MKVSKRAFKASWAKIDKPHIIFADGKWCYYQSFDHLDFDADRFCQKLNNKAKRNNPEEG